jgi:AraC family transcriptional regulator, regulatory protein of adaptative response / methylated-DNA-[protein]-cysteine methyltransferase
MSDYERIAQAITFITASVNSQPTLDEIAAQLHLSPFHFQRLFSRWAGVTPKRFLQVLTLERAKQLLSVATPILEVSDSLGLSSGSRLYDHFVQLEAVTPGEFKLGGAGLTIEYALLDTPFGKTFIAATERGICNLEFLDNAEIEAHLIYFAKKWPYATLRENQQRIREIVTVLFSSERKLDSAENKPERPLSLIVTGTNFQINVWQALLRIPPGKVVSYKQLANDTGNPGAARAVGQAVGANPVAFLIPCHRVILQSGKLGGYHWGETRKHAIHAWESARHG